MPLPPGAPYHGPDPGPRARPYAPRTPRGPASSWEARTSQAERDHVVDQLGNAFAEGRLGHAEFDRRLQLAMTAVTRAELVPLLDDLPGAGGAMRPGAAMAPSHPTDTHVPSTNDRTVGALCHLTALFTSFVGPLVLLLTVGRDSKFVRDQAAESLNFQLTFLLANMALGVATVMTLGLAALLYIPLGIGWLVFVLIGSCTPLLGKAYRYPLNLRLVR